MPSTIEKVYRELKGKKLAGKFKGKAQVWMLPLESKDPFSFSQNGQKSVTPKLVGKGKVGAHRIRTVHGVGYALEAVDDEGGS